MTTEANERVKFELRPVAVKHALLVDADAQLLASVAKILQPSPWAIHNVGSNAAALALIQQRPFDLIITGARTSAREDVELLRKIRTVRPHTRLIIMTDESTPSDVITAMRERAISYFSTPFSQDVLAQPLRRLQPSR